MRRWVRLYALGVVTQAKVMAQYRTSALLDVISDLAWQAARIGFIGLLYALVSDLGGWTASEAILMATAGWLSMYIELFVFRIAVNIDFFIHEGRLDYALVRPVPLLVWTPVIRMKSDTLFKVVGLTAVLVGTMAAAGVFANPISILLILLGLLAGVFVWAGMHMTLFASAAWLTRVRSLVHGFAALHEHTKYPLEILSEPLRVGMTVVPFAFTAYYPVAFALRPEQHWLPGAFALPVGIATVAVGLTVFHLALRRYESVGSSEVFGGW